MTPFRSALAMWLFAAALLIALRLLVGPSYVIGTASASEMVCATHTEYGRTVTIYPQDPDAQTYLVSVTVVNGGALVTWYTCKELPR